MNTIILVFLILLLLGALPNVSGHNYGYVPSGGLGLVLIIVLILVLMGRI